MKNYGISGGEAESHDTTGSPGEGEYEGHTDASANLRQQDEGVEEQEQEQERKEGDQDEHVEEDDDEAQQPENESGCRGQEQQHTGNNQILAGTTQNADDATSYQRRWAELYQRLIEFKERHGHCRVPNRYEEDPQLGYWVSTQRRQHRLTNTPGNDVVPLSRERANMLEAIGFEWSAVPASHKSWDGRFDELREYVVRGKKFYCICAAEAKEPDLRMNALAKEGHAQVPMGYSENPRLATWVSTQRQEYKLRMKGRSSRLTDEKKKKLDSVGFVWEAPRGRRKSTPGPGKADSSKKDSDSIHEEGEEDDDEDERKPAATASPRDPPAGSESMQSTDAATATAGQDVAQSLQPRPQASLAAASGLHMRSAALPDATTGGAPTVAQLPLPAAAIGPPALLGGAQPNVATDLPQAPPPAASADQALLVRSLAAFFAGQGQGPSPSGPAAEESAAQILIRHLSDLSAANVTFRGLPPNLATLSDAQSPQQTLLDRLVRQQQQQASELYQQTFLHQLAQQQASEQQRQLQQLEALRILQALSSPAASLQLSLALQSNPPTMSPLLHRSNASSSSTSTRASLPVQNLTEQQPQHVTMEGLQQAHLLLAARQLGNEEVPVRRQPQEPEATYVEDEKTTDQEDLPSATGTRRRPADSAQLDREPTSRRRL